MYHCNKNHDTYSACYVDGLMGMLLWTFPPKPRILSCDCNAIYYDMTVLNQIWGDPKVQILTLSFWAIRLFKIKMVNVGTSASLHSIHSLKLLYVWSWLLLVKFWLNISSNHVNCQLLITWPPRCMIRQHWKWIKIWYQGIHQSSRFVCQPIKQL